VRETLVRLVDALEDRAPGYLTLDDVAAAGAEGLESAIAEHVLLIDYRRRPDGTPMTLVRLNRRHPLVIRLTAW